MRLKVDVFGCINDHKFTTHGSGHIDPDTGEADIRLCYSSCPPEWTPLNYSDPLVLLAGYKEVNGGMNFLSLAKGGYHAESTIDFGSGLLLRKTATIRIEGDTLIAAYSLFGAARVGNIVGIEPYEEHMIPAGDGQIIAIGLAQWKTSDNKIIQAVVSSRYFFEEPKEVLKRHQIRRFEVIASLAKDGLEYNGRYKTSVAIV
jgi:hypothetical protein